MQELILIVSISTSAVILAMTTYIVLAIRKEEKKDERS